jgi:hypothetical protein
MKHRTFLPALGLVMVLELVISIAGQTNTPRVISTSPAEIAGLVNQKQRKGSPQDTVPDLSPIWKDLGIDEGGFANCAGFCRAKVFDHELDGKPGQETIVKLTGPVELCRYLIFDRASKGWRFLGNIDHDFNKYEMSRHRVEHTPEHTWLVIRGQEGSGSGFALYGETWYQISAEGIRRVLSYPGQGHTYPGASGIGREFKALRIPTSNASRLAKDLILQYTVTYTASHYDDDSSRIFVNTHQARYTWDNNTLNFVFDNNGSSISENEIDAIANIQSDDEAGSDVKIGRTTFYSQAKAFAGGGYEVFLKYNSAALMKIATGSKAGPKDWLRRFLNECDETTEKIALLSALNKSP